MSQSPASALLASGVPLSHAASQSGLARQSVYNWLNQDQLQCLKPGWNLSVTLNR